MKKIDKYEGYNDDSRFKEAVITLLENILEKLTPAEPVVEDKEALAKVINTIEKKSRKKKEVKEVK